MQSFRAFVGVMVLMTAAAAMPVSHWSVDDVQNWLSDVGSTVGAEGRQAFLDNKVDGGLLMALEPSDLKELHVADPEGLFSSIRDMSSAATANMTGSATVPLYPTVKVRASWLPSMQEFVDDLTYVPPLSADFDTRIVGTEEFRIFDGYAWTRLTSHHWEIPLIACVVYVAMVFGMPIIMRDRTPIRARRAVIVWNLMLSGFSVCGALWTVGTLLFASNTGLLKHGFYRSVCSHPMYYGSGYVGLFVCLFIYSKLFELVDTVFLLMRKNPVILLHWYHHVTVLLYCWHSYSVRISSGLWFAAMNYLVHAFMYFYFAMTQISPRARKMVRPFAIVLTALQLVQMVVGIVVTVASATYSAARGYGCHSNATNSLLGFIMYLSYFILFGQLFCDRYSSPRGKRKQA